MSMGGILRDLKSCTLEVQEKKTIGSCIVDVCVCVCFFSFTKRRLFMDTFWICIFIVVIYKYVWL